MAKDNNKKNAPKSSTTTKTDKKEEKVVETPVVEEQPQEEVTQYVDEFGNPIDPSLIDENGNYIGQKVEYVDEYGNPIDPSLIDENGNYIGNQKQEYTVQDLQAASTSAKAMDDKELLTGMVTFDYNNVPISDIVNSIILDGINKGASDIHFDPTADGIRIRIRIDGQLNDYAMVPLYVKNNLITRIKIISSMNITESRMPQDGAIRTELADKTIDLRVACLPTSMGEKLVMRIMDYTMSANGVEGLDFSPKNLEKVNQMLALPNGIVLVTGATGTGKSTTVYSMLQVLNTNTRNIITVEDPIEMNIPGINQVQAQEEIGLNFAEVLRSILREDPDVIMIGEIRDDETARIAVRASITGHLVLSTLHTNNSLNTIERLTDMSVERYLLGSSLEGVISQRLARRLCPHCRNKRPTSEYEKEVFKKALNQDVNEIYIPQGCDECTNGYRGRIAIHEVLLINQAIRDAITKGVDKATLRKLVYNDGDTDTMLQDGLQKVLLGETSFDEVLKLIDLGDEYEMDDNASLEEQMQDSITTPQPEQGQPMYMPYPVPMQLDPEMLKQLLELSKNIPNNNKKEETKEEPETEVKPEEMVDIDDSDEEIEELQDNSYLDNLESNELKSEELSTQELSSMEDEIDLINTNLYEDDNKEEQPIEELQDDKEHEEQPIVTLSLNETNTVKPIPVNTDDGYETVTVSKKAKKPNYEDDMEIVTIKPKSRSKANFDDDLVDDLDDDFISEDEVNSILDNIE